MKEYKVYGTDSNGKRFIYQVAPVEKTRYFSDEMNQCLGRPPV